MATLERLFSVLGSSKHTYASRIVLKGSSLLLKGGAYWTRALIAKSYSFPGAVIRSFTVVPYFPLQFNAIEL